MGERGRCAKVIGRGRDGKSSRRQRNTIAVVTMLNHLITLLLIVDGSGDDGAGGADDG